MRDFTLLLLQPISARLKFRIEREIPEGRLLGGANPSEPADEWGNAEIAYGLPGPDQLETIPNLKWIHLPQATVPEGICVLAKRHGFMLTKASGACHQSVAEHTLFVMLSLLRQWSKVPPQDESRAETLSGSTVAILGTGRVGRSIARLTKAFGMQTLGCRRRPQPTPFIDRVYGPDDLSEMASQAEWVVIALPLTHQTAGMLDASFFAAMRPGYRLVSVSPAEVFNWSELETAFESGRLSGIAIDVPQENSLPDNSPLVRMQGSIATCGVAGLPAIQRGHLDDHFLLNLHRYLAGLPLEGLVDLELSY